MSKAQKSTWKILLRIFVIFVAVGFLLSGFMMMVWGNYLNQFLESQAEYNFDQFESEKEVLGFFIVVFIVEGFSNVIGVGGLNIVPYLTLIGLFDFMVGVLLFILSFRIDIAKKKKAH